MSIGLMPTEQTEAHPAGMIQSVVCDTCGAHTPVTNAHPQGVPSSWLTVRQGDGPDAPCWHFCSDTCAESWLHERSPHLDVAAAVAATQAAMSAPNAVPAEDGEVEEEGETDEGDA